VTSFREGVSDAIVDLSVSDDGQWVAFISKGNLTGQNHDRSQELFTMARDGSSLVQVTNDPAPNAGAVSVLAMAGSGAKVAFACSSNLTGGNPQHAQQIFLVNRDGTGLSQVSNFADSEVTYLSVSDDATKIAFASDADPFGTNADGNYDLFEINDNGSGLKQLTASTGADLYEDSIVWVQLSGNGSKIAFQSNRNLVGTNADVSAEIFDINCDGTGLRQLTTSPIYESIFPGITDDGLTVYFSSLKSGAAYRLYKIQADGTGEVELALTALYGGNMVLSGSGNRLAFSNFGVLKVIDTTGSNLLTLLTRASHTANGAAVPPDGSFVLFTSDANLTGSNPDGSTELFRVNPNGTGLSQISNNVEMIEPTIGNNDLTVFFSSLIS
jgi:Tol biopolymer transport system component